MEDYTGLPLTAFVDGVNDQMVLVCLDEQGNRFEYKGPSNPFSSTTMYGRWTGPAAYFDDLPVKVMGRNGKQTSALDSFSMLYAIETYDKGHHSEEINRQYVERIVAALNRGVIAPYRDMDEFTTANRIVDSFQRTGHMFDAISNEGKLMYAASLGATVHASRWIEHDASQSFPMFQFTESEQQQIQEVFDANPGVAIETTDDVIHWMEAAGLGHTYATTWLKQRKLHERQMKHATDHIVEQMKTLRRDSRYLPRWENVAKKSYVPVNNTVSIESIAHDITTSILENLL